ncbi:rhombosortase [Aestuariibacter sp. AA17]|uniref:Rhombosortase n=1 Tax=Fluctibacter corallii TaxID=2984329 RepID=A0ABT3A9M7_9ALTE|nr:rhombosortase [Aestuariibacter sp. AA17]MCV2885378.1 rhombosortase [Aestuariibacter sp. AA17]
MSFHLKYLIGPLAFLTLSILLAVLDDSRVWLVYEQDKILEGEYWRFISANLLHTNHYHLLLNGLGLLLLWKIHYFHYSTLKYSLVWLISSLFTTVGIFLFSQDLHWYVGMSGTLHGIFVWGALSDITKGLKSGWLLLVGVVGKLIYEQTVGADAAIASLIDANVAVDAHLYGAIGGVFSFLFLRYCLSPFLTKKGT